ncbi:hypothetical protein DFA_10744 [Cavenderia fasciculata]|uniref:G8 domain-containing protein n=1 Tax=Cavenderia fasciculata TaxID=261658 RepID=F4QB99_CACFS|nr:uncharacterized protein DFA_10744 [Cavenderia fasciculata]EGG14871.1 hypothetical protein DFA_10744 [Cavenderia fasciculata]|eukprot:XP_004351387.1 hypothetical protein DFA_10744 [Cavenderia fasciculata]
MINCFKGRIIHLISLLLIFVSLLLTQDNSCNGTETTTTTTTSSNNKHSDLNRWSDINTWSNKRLPIDGDNVVISTCVLLDINPPFLSSLTIDGEDGLFQCKHTTHGSSLLYVGSIVITNNATMIISSSSSSSPGSTFYLKSSGTITIDNGGELIIRGQQLLKKQPRIGLEKRNVVISGPTFRVGGKGANNGGGGGRLSISNSIIHSCNAIIAEEQTIKLNVLNNLIICNHHQNNNNMTNNNNNNTTSTTIIQLNNISSSNIIGNTIIFNNTKINNNINNNESTTSANITFIEMKGGYNNNISFNYLKSKLSSSLSSSFDNDVVTTIGFKLLFINQNDNSNVLNSFTNNTSIHNKYGVVVDYYSPNNQQQQLFIEPMTSIVLRGLLCISNKIGVWSKIRNVSILDSSFIHNGMGVLIKGDMLLSNHLFSTSSPSIIQIISNSRFIGSHQEEEEDSHAIELIDGTLLIDQCSFKSFKYPITFTTNDLTKIIYLNDIDYKNIIHPIEFKQNNLLTEYVKDLDGSTTSKKDSSGSSRDRSIQPVVDKYQFLKDIQSQTDSTTIVRDIEFFRVLPICQSLEWWPGVLFCDNSFSSFIQFNVLVHFEQQDISNNNNNNNTNINVEEEQCHLEMTMGDGNVVDLGSGIPFNLNVPNNQHFKMFQTMVPSGVAIQFYPTNFNNQHGNNNNNINSIMVIKIQQIFWDKGDYLKFELPINRFLNNSKPRSIHKFNFQTPPLSSTVPTTTSFNSTSRKHVHSSYPANYINFYRLEETAYISIYPNQQNHSRK